MRIVLLDERTVREYPSADGRGARISLRRARRQLPPPPQPVPFTIVVAAAPILGSDLVEDVIQPLFDVLLPGGARFTDFESWSAVRANHQDLLARLAAHDPVVVLSGDVHYGFTTQLHPDRGRRHHHGSRSSRRRRRRTSSQERGDQPVQRADHAPRSRTRHARRPGSRRCRPPTDQATVRAASRLGAGLGRHRRRAARAGRARGRLGADGNPHPGGDGLRPGGAGWTYVVEPVDDPMATTPPPAVDAPWPGWDPAKSLRMSAALQDADLERFARVFVGLPQLAVVTFKIAGGRLTVQHELRCPVGSVEPGLPARPPRRQDRGGVDMTDPPVGLRAAHRDGVEVIDTASPASSPCRRSSPRASRRPTRCGWRRSSRPRRRRRARRSPRAATRTSATRCGRGETISSSSPTVVLTPLAAAGVVGAELLEALVIELLRFKFARLASMLSLAGAIVDHPGLGLALRLGGAARLHAGHPGARRRDVLGRPVRRRPTGQAAGCRRCSRRC